MVLISLKVWTHQVTNIQPDMMKRMKLCSMELKSLMKRNTETVRDLSLCVPAQYVVEKL